VDAAPALHLGANDTVLVSGLTPGAHQAELSGIVDNCELAGPNPRTVTASASLVGHVRFEVSCVAPAGSLNVAVTTTGENLDPDGYELTVDQAAPVPVGIDGEVRFDGLRPGTHEVRLTGIAPNCKVADGSRRSAAVPAAGVAEVEFVFECGTGTGSIEVNVTTTSLALDPDGYLVSLDGGQPQVAPGQSTTRFGDVTEGNHTVELTGVATNCLVQGQNPRLVTVAAGHVTALEFAVSCAGTGLSGILFQRTSTFPRYRLYRMRPDGSGVIELTPGSDGQEGAWSPGGQRIAFTSYRDGNAEIYVMNADGSGVIRLTSDPANDTEPAWSPDGEKIAFVSTRSGASNVYVMNANGTGVVSLTGDAGGFEPSWSPDGSRIAFARVTRLCQFDVCAADVLVVPATGGPATNLTLNAGGAAYQPAWSPDGSRIAYAQERQIFVILPDGTGKVRLSLDADAQDVAPVWAPDGAKLAFTRYTANGSRIFVMNADGTGATGISPGAAGEQATSWR
jgi:TolB protein